MKVKELLNAVKKEIRQDKIESTKQMLKERLLEIEETEKALSTLKAQLKEMLNRTI